MYDKYIKTMRLKYKGGNNESETENKSGFFSRFKRSKEEEPIITQSTSDEKTNPIIEKTISDASSSTGFFSNLFSRKESDNVVADVKKIQTKEELETENKNKVIYFTSLGALGAQFATMIYWFIKS